MKKKRGRPSNWEGILEVIGWNSYNAIRKGVLLTKEARGGTPSRDAILRLARATLNATHSAEIDFKRKSAEWRERKVNHAG